MCQSAHSFDDWPQWRGKNRDGVWSESNIVAELPAEPDVTWRVKIGAGYSGPTVADGKVYVMDRMTEPKTVERVLCFDAETGKPVWQHEYVSQYKIGYPAGPRASVTIDGGFAYSHGAMGQLICFQANDGTVVWEKDLNAAYSIANRDRKLNRMPVWGMTCSPIIYDNLVILQIGANDAGVVAFDRKTGNEVWKATNDRGQYSSPVLISQGEHDVLVCWTGDSVCGIGPGDGTVHWQIPWKPINMPIGCASPVVNKDHIFCTSFYDGSMLIKLDPDQPNAEKVWHQIGVNERQTKAMHSMISTPIWLGSHIYGVDSYGELRCLEAKSGTRVWENLTAVPKSRWSTIHFVHSGDQESELVWMFTERGELINARLSPERFEEISRLKIIEPTRKQLNQRGGVCWSHPAFAMKSVFVRNDNELVRVNLAR